MKELSINSENVNSIKWDEDCYKCCEFIDFSIEGEVIDSDFNYCSFTDIEWYLGLFNIVSFVDCTFKSCVFRGTSFPDCKFVECEFIDCKFIKDNLNGDCVFSDAKSYNCKVISTEGFIINSCNA